jgi:hypothetical protein
MQPPPQQQQPQPIGLALKRQTHLYCRACGECQSAYSNTVCDSPTCGAALTDPMYCMRAPVTRRGVFFSAE